MVNVKNKPQNEAEEVEKITELYLKLERLQGYLRRIDGRVKKHELDLKVLRKAREKKEGELLRGLKKGKAKVSDQTI